MTVRVYNKIDFNKIGNNKVESIQRALPAALQEEVSRMIVRTTGGRDVSDNPFIEYSPGYKKFKAKKNRNVSPPDLTYTGRMLTSITSATKRIGDIIRGEIFFASEAEATKARGNQRYRKFFGLSEEQVERIQQKIRDALRLR